MTVKQISVFLENKPGKMAEFTKLLSNNQVDLRAISIAESADFGIVRIIVGDVISTMTVLKDADYVCKVTKVLAVEIKDEPGALADMITILSEADINIEYMYALTTKKKDVAYMILRVGDNERTAAVLAEHGMRVVCQEDLV